ncbi:MAG: hypothetical protein AB7U61_10130 [Methylocystis sp.]
MRRNEVRGFAMLDDREAAHQAARIAGVEDVENDELRRAAGDADFG